METTAKLPRVGRAWLIFVAALALPLSLCAKEIRASLLDDEEVLTETSSLLLQNGCSRESVEAFGKAVRFHKTDLLDTSKLPEKTSGFYHFKNVGDLNNALPDIFCNKARTNRTSKDTIAWSEAPHNSLVCLDLVVLLTKDAGAKATKVKEGFAEKGFAKYENKGSDEKPVFVVNPVSSLEFYQDGSTLLYPANAYSAITGLERSQSEVDLAISLKGERLLQGKFVDTDQALRQLFATWNNLRKKDGLEFPSTFRIVTVGYVPMRFRYWAIDHVALVMTGVDHRVSIDKKGTLTSNVKLIYLEKNGTRGPYLRIDFNDETEIGEFAAQKLLPFSSDPKEINYQAPVFVSVNDRLIRIARP